MRNLKINIKKMLALGGVVLTLVTTTACSKKADCSIPTFHAHKYVSQEGFVRYLPEEWEEYEGYQRQEEHKELRESQRDLYRYFDQKDLLRIDDNIEQIKAAEERNQPFIEYRYSYIYLSPVPIIIPTGKTTIVTFTFIPVRHYSWTNDPNHANLTGEKRYCTYSYTSYKIEIDEHGNRVLIPCLEHANIIDYKDEYPYIKKDFYKVIDATKGHEAELDYENLTDDNVDNIREDDGSYEVKEETPNTSKTLTKRI